MNIDEVLKSIIVGYDWLKWIDTNTNKNGQSVNKWSFTCCWSGLRHLQVGSERDRSRMMEFGGEMSGYHGCTWLPCGSVQIGWCNESIWWRGNSSALIWWQLGMPASCRILSILCPFLLMRWKLEGWIRLFQCLWHADHIVSSFHSHAFCKQQWEIVSSSRELRDEISLRQKMLPENDSKNLLPGCQAVLDHQLWRNDDERSHERWVVVLARWLRCGKFLLGG